LLLYKEVIPSWPPHRVNNTQSFQNAQAHLVSVDSSV